MRNNEKQWELNVHSMYILYILFMSTWLQVFAKIAVWWSDEFAIWTSWATWRIWRQFRSSMSQTNCMHKLGDTGDTGELVSQCLTNTLQLSSPERLKKQTRQNGCIHVGKGMKNKWISEVPKVSQRNGKNLRKFFFAVDVVPLCSAGHLRPPALVQCVWWCVPLVATATFHRMQGCFGAAFLRRIWQARQGMAGHGRAWQGMAGHGRAWQGMAGHGRAWQGMAGQRANLGHVILISVCQLKVLKWYLGSDQSPHAREVKLVKDAKRGSLLEHFGSVWL